MRAAAAMLATAVAACGSGGTRVAAPVAQLDPGNFTTNIDNPYWPMTPGTRWVYSEDGENGRKQRVTVTVTSRTKRVAAGIRGRVVHDVVTQGGKVIEDTYDWYAQDSKGNVWYLGEDTTEFESGGRRNHEGSWEAGVDGARAGIMMLAHPRVGRRYRQEHYKGHAEDRAVVISLNGRGRVPWRSFSGALVTRDSNPLSPGPWEHKYYVKGVGPVLTVSRGGSREELVPFDRAPRGG